MTEKITSVDPDSEPARAMLDALWGEIQRRYGFTAPNPMGADLFAEPPGRFWLATVDDIPVGSVGITAHTETALELDAMYVTPEVRGTGTAQRLLAAAEEYASSLGYQAIRLRTGEPQPESVRFYEKAGYRRIPRFGKWLEDDTAWCFEKALSTPAETG
ncbi:GNAT family N-acetyltransferase [Herbihabitans rhizosphaerae]|uniref:GNAT family N-acetyltransferase n=1 Tax=Herbihabitans rhizosphaerae TaxID=1872711 RepID=UPI001A9337BF|nr:GNAT family N-acetyltransferase [Herbihabitans rhizosphaerae]